MEFLESIIDMISNGTEYILGLFSYLIESANNILSVGDILLFVLVVLLILKIKNNVNPKS